MITYQKVLRAIERDDLDTTSHAKMRLAQRGIQVAEIAMALRESNVDLSYARGSWHVPSPRLVTVVVYHGKTLSMVWGDAYGQVSLITVHYGQSHEEVVPAHDDYYCPIGDMRKSAA